MSALAFIFFYLAMFVNAIVFSALGQGGGTLYTPIQIFFGIEFHTAATTSLFLIMVTSLSSTLVFRKAKVVDWFMAFAFVSATTIGAFLGGMYSGHFTGRFLTYLFAAVMALAGVFMVRQFGSLTWSQAGGRRFYLWERHAGEEHYCINLALALPLLFCSGSIAGLIGVSGGILNVPMMVLLLGVFDGRFHRAYDRRSHQLAGGAGAGAGHVPGRPDRPAQGRQGGQAAAEGVLRLVPVRAGGAAGGADRNEGVARWDCTEHPCCGPGPGRNGGDGGRPAACS